MAAIPPNDSMPELNSRRSADCWTPDNANRSLNEENRDELTGRDDHAHRRFTYHAVPDACSAEAEWEMIPHRD
jgi:hypothetical protein